LLPDADVRARGGQGVRDRGGHWGRGSSGAAWLREYRAVGDAKCWITRL
jgi:hypothetical protein